MMHGSDMAAGAELGSDNLKITQATPRLDYNDVTGNESPGATHSVEYQCASSSSPVHRGPNDPAYFHMKGKNQTLYQNMMFF